MFNKIDVEYRIRATTKTGQTIKRSGHCGLTIIEESLHHAFTNVYFFVLAEFIKQELGGDSSQLTLLKNYSFKIKKICIK